MKKMLVVLFFFVFLFNGCGFGENKVNIVVEMFEVLDVKLIGFEKVNFGESVVYEVVVLYGDEVVMDVDEVEFEVWKEGEKDVSYMFKVK